MLLGHVGMVQELVLGLSGGVILLQDLLKSPLHLAAARL